MPTEGRAAPSGARERRRPIACCRANAGIAATLLVAGWLLLGFSAGAKHEQDMATQTSRVSAAVEALHGMESELNAGEITIDDARARARRAVADLDALVRPLAADVAQVVEPELHEVEAALTEQFTLVEQGATATADQVDRARIDPAFARLHSDLAVLTNREVAEAALAFAHERDVSLLVILLAIGLTVFISWRSRRQAQRTAALAERALVVAASDRRFRALVNHGDDVIIVADRDAVIQEMSDSVEHVLGVEPSQRIGRRIPDLVHPDEKQAAEADFAKAVATGSAGPSQLRCRGGRAEWHNIEVTWTNLLEVPEVGGVVLNVRDVTDRYQLEEELRHRAFHDSLTGLANRALLRDRIGHAMAVRERCRAALLVVDLDGFKHLNDSLGHPAGDHALAVVAQRLLAACRPEDTVARLGGDEFAILVEQPLRPQTVHALGRRIAASVAQAFEWESHSVTVGASIGIAFVDAGVHTADDLVRNADVALYAAKAAGRGRVRAFDTDLFDAARTRFELENDLRTSVADGQLRLRYQPIVTLDTEQTIGFEALLRWAHPTRGLLAPDVFVPIAEESDLIVPIGRWVLQRACADLAAWTAAHPEAAHLTVSINLSARQLQGVGIVKDVRDAISASGLDPQRVVLEITETALMCDVDAARERLAALKALGVRVSVDDFGTGYSSLSYLRQFPIDTVKIDKSFVDCISESADDTTFVDAILRLSETLDLDTLAEGIESGAQADVLRALGCHLGQGFHYARPLDTNEVDTFLVDGHASTDVLVAAATG